MERWPALRYEAWRDTYQTLHLWTQFESTYEAGTQLAQWDREALERKAR